MFILFKLVKLGYKFSQTWPKKEPYLQMFDQTKVIKLTDLAMTVSPAIALLTIWLQVSQLGFEYLNVSLAMTLLVLSMPFHGYYQLGKQAELRLPIGLQSWYRELEQKSLSQDQFEYLETSHVRNEEGNKKSAEFPAPLPGTKKANRHLTYMDLAFLLNRIFNKRN